MRSKTLLAFAAASAFALPVVHANAWDQSASMGSSDELTAPNIGDQAGPMEQTWYYPDGTIAYHYPDGTVAYHQGDTVVVVLPDGQVSTSLVYSEDADAAAAS